MASSEAHSAGVSRQVPDEVPGCPKELEGVSGICGGGTGGAYIGENARGGGDYAAVVAAIASWTRDSSSAKEMIIR